MRPRTAAFCAALLLTATQARAHRLDEYLQATTLSLEKARVEVQMRLAPGVAVFPAVFAGIDTNADGVVSDAEQRAYAEAVRRDVTLKIDGEAVTLRLVSAQLDPVELLREGRGYIQLDFDARVPDRARNRRLTFENAHQRPISVYLVNSLVPADRDIRVTGQDRSYDQASYTLDYVEASARLGWPAFGGWAESSAMLGAGAVLLLAMSSRRRRGKP